MSQRARVLEIAKRVPGWLRDLRARLLLEAWAEFMGVPETECPACDGLGRLDGWPLQRCPICMGFGEVPCSLAEWFEHQVMGEELEQPRCRVTKRRLRPSPALARGAASGRPLQAAAERPEGGG